MTLFIVYVLFCIIILFLLGEDYCVSVLIKCGTFSSVMYHDSQ